MTPAQVDSKVHFLQILHPHPTRPRGSGPLGHRHGESCPWGSQKAVGSRPRLLQGPRVAASEAADTLAPSRAGNCPLSVLVGNLTVCRIISYPFVLLYPHNTLGRGKKRGLRGDATPFTEVEWGAQRG